MSDCNCRRRQAAGGLGEAAGQDSPSRCIKFHIRLLTWIVLFTLANPNASTAVNTVDRKNPEAQSEPAVKGPSNPNAHECDLCADNWLFILEEGGGSGPGETALGMLQQVPGIELGAEENGVLRILRSVILQVKQLHSKWGVGAAFSSHNAWEPHLWKCMAQSMIKDALKIASDRSANQASGTRILGFKEVRYTDNNYIRFISSVFPCARFIFTASRLSLSSSTGMPHRNIGKPDDHETRPGNFLLVEELSRNFSESTRLLWDSDASNAEAYNDILSDFLGVKGCRFTQGDSREKPGKLQGSCDFSNVDFSKRGNHVSFPSDLLEVPESNEEGDQGRPSKAQQLSSPEVPSGGIYTEPPAEACDLCADNWLFVLGAGGRTGSSTALGMFRQVPGIELSGEDRGILHNLRNFVTTVKHLQFRPRDADAAWSIHSEWEPHLWKCEVQNFVKKIVLDSQYWNLAASTRVLGFKEIRYANEEDMRFIASVFPCARYVFTARSHPEDPKANPRFTTREEWSERAAYVQDLHGRFPNATRILWVEQLTAKAYNEVLHDFLGVKGCSFNGVLENNHKGAYRLDKRSTLGGECDLSDIDFAAREGHVHFPSKRVDAFAVPVIAKQVR